MAKRPNLPIIFRKHWNGEAWDLCAYFPTLLGTNDPYTVTCYAHVGQHGSASMSWCSKGKRATREEYHDLAMELSGIYSQDDDPDAVTLVVFQRYQPWFTLHRMQEARNMRRSHG